jgi:predicted Zn-dependent peptidase
VDVWVRAGSAEERENEHGAAHFLEHLLFRGTATRASGAADEAIERLGGLLNAGTTRDAAHVYTVVPSEHVRDALDVICDVISAPALASEHVDLERNVIVDELARSGDDPERVVTDAAFRAAWPADPYGRPVLSEPDEIAAIQRDAIVAFHQRCYRPERIVVVVAGETTPAVAHDAVARVFSALRRTGEPEDPPVGSPVEPSGPTGPMRVVAGKGRPSVNLWAWRMGRSDTREALLAELTGLILEDAVAAARSPGTRPYSIASLRSQTVTLRRGSLVYLAADGEPIGVGLIEAAVQRLTSDGPTTFELASAKHRLRGLRLFRTETCAGLAREIGSWALMGDAEAAVELDDRLKLIKEEDVRAYCRKWLPRPERKEVGKP